MKDLLKATKHYDCRKRTEPSLQARRQSLIRSVVTFMTVSVAWWYSHPIDVTHCQTISSQYNKIRGHPFMTSTKNLIFDPPPSVHMRPQEPDPSTLWTATCGRHEIHIALLKRLVQWPSGPKAEIRFYDCNLFKTVLLIIFITSLYHRKNFTFIPSKDKILVKRTPTSLHEKKTGWTLILIFCVDVHMGLDPPLSRPHASSWAWPPSPPCGRHKWMAPLLFFRLVAKKIWD